MQISASQNGESSKWDGAVETDPASRPETDTQSLTGSTSTDQLSIPKVGKRWLRRALAGIVRPSEDKFPSKVSEQTLAEWKPWLYYVPIGQTVLSYSYGWTIPNPFDEYTARRLYSKYEFTADRDWIPDSLAKPITELAKEYEVPGDDENFSKLQHQDDMVKYSLAMSNDVLCYLARNFDWKGVGEAAQVQARIDFFTKGCVTLPGATEATPVPAVFHLTEAALSVMSEQCMSHLARSDRYDQLWPRGKVPKELSQGGDGGASSALTRAANRAGSVVELFSCILS